MDVTGRVLFTSALNATANNSETFDFSSFAKGTYLLKLTTEKGSATKKIILE